MLPNNKNKVFNNNKNTYFNSITPPCNNGFFQHSSLKFKAPIQKLKTNTAQNPISQSLISTISGNSNVGQQWFAQSLVSQGKPHFPANTTLANTNNKKPVNSVFRSLLPKSQQGQATSIAQALNKNKTSIKQTTSICLATPSVIINFADKTEANKTLNTNISIKKPLHNTPVEVNNSDVTDNELQSIIWSPEDKPVAKPVLDADRDFPPLVLDQPAANSPAPVELETISIAQTAELHTEEPTETPSSAPSESNNPSSSFETGISDESVLKAADNDAGTDKDEPVKNGWAQWFFAGIRNGLSSFVKIPGQLFGTIFNLFSFKRA